MTSVELEAIRARAAATLPPPWEWSGNTASDNVHLATAHSGRVFIIQPHTEIERGYQQTEEPWAFISEDDFFKLPSKARREIEAINSPWVFEPRSTFHLLFPHRESSFRKEGGKHGLSSHREIARYEVLDFQTREEAGLAPDADMTNSPLYREDFMGLDSPEATFIAHSRADIEALLAGVDRLRELADA